MKIKMMHMGKDYSIEEIGIFTPDAVEVKELAAGDVGYITCSIHDPKLVRVGDTITDSKHPVEKPLEGYRQLKPLVFCGVYPVNTKDYMTIREAIEKCHLKKTPYPQDRPVVLCNGSAA